MQEIVDRRLSNARELLELAGKELDALDEILPDMDWIRSIARARIGVRFCDEALRSAETLALKNRMLIRQYSRIP